MKLPANLREQKAMQETAKVCLAQMERLRQTSRAISRLVKKHGFDLEPDVKIEFKDARSNISDAINHLDNILAEMQPVVKLVNKNEQQRIDKADNR